MNVFFTACICIVIAKWKKKEKRNYLLIGYDYYKGVKVVSFP